MHPCVYACSWVPVCVCVCLRPLEFSYATYLPALWIQHFHGPLGVGLGAACADVVESPNAILKRAYNDHTARGGGGGMPGATALEREAEVLLQAWEWWLSKLDLPLQHHGAPQSAPCTMAKLMAIQSPPPSFFSSPPLALVSPPDGPKHVEVPLGGHVESPRRPPDMLVLLVVCFLCSLIFGQFQLSLVGSY